MSKLTRSEAAKLKGVSVSTLRRWESEGKLIPERTANGIVVIPSLSCLE